jgi:hypothetical protein
MSERRRALKLREKLKEIRSEEKEKVLYKLVSVLLCCVAILWLL